MFALKFKIQKMAEAAQVSYPLKVTYCGACSMPLEYCEYSTCKDKCREWLEKNLPDMAGEVVIGDNGDEKKHQVSHYIYLISHLISCF